MAEYSLLTKPSERPLTGKLTLKFPKSEAENDPKCLLILDKQSTKQFELRRNRFGNLSNEKSSNPIPIHARAIDYRILRIFLISSLSMLDTTGSIHLGVP